MKQYLLSVYQPDGDPPPAEILAEITRDVEAVRAGLRAAGAWVFTDGPFAEGKEHVGGFSVISAADLDEALGWARRFAVACRLPVEVRPMTVMERG